MGPPPRSLTAEANSCFMVRVLHGPNRIQGCGASISPERGLPSDQLYRTSNNQGHRVPVTLYTRVLIQGCVKTPTANLRKEPLSQSPSKEEKRENNSAHSLLVHVFTQPGSQTEVRARNREVRFALVSGHRYAAPACPEKRNNGLSRHKIKTVRQRNQYVA